MTVFLVKIGQQGSNSPVCSWVEVVDAMVMKRSSAATVLWAAPAKTVRARAAARKSRLRESLSVLL